MKKFLLGAAALTAMLLSACGPADSSPVLPSSPDEPSIPVEPSAPEEPSTPEEPSEPSIPEEPSESEPVEILPISITAENLLGYQGSNISYGDGYATIESIDFNWLECGAYGSGIQMRTKNGKSSTIWNSVAFENPIKQIGITVHEGKGGYANEHALYFSFGDAADKLGEPVAWNSVADQYEYTIDVEGDPTFFKLTHGTSYSLYIDTFTFIF